MTMRRILTASKTKKLASLVIFTALAGSAYATTFVQGKYAGTPNETTCSTCDDGDADFFLANASVVDDASNTATGKAFQFDVQLRFKPGQTIANVNLADVQIFIQYNTDAFGKNVASKCTLTNGSVTAGAGAFTRVPLNSTSPADSTDNRLGITYNSNAKALGPAFAPSSFLSPITFAYQTVVTVKCQIADLSKTAGVAMHAASWNQTTTLKGPNAQDKFVTTAQNDLTGFRLDGAPSVVDYAVWDQNSGVEITFDTAVTVDKSATYTFGVRAEGATGTDIVTSLNSTQIEVSGMVVTLKDLFTTDGVRPNISSSQMFVVVGPRVVKNASDESKTHAAASELFVLPPFDDAKNPVVGSAKLNAANTTLTITFNGASLIASSATSDFQLTSNLSPAPTITGISVNSDLAQVLLTLSGAGSKLGTDTISLRLGRTAVSRQASSTDYAAPIQRQLQNITLNDNIAPNVTYTLTSWVKSTTKNRDSAFVDYDTLTYTIDIDEQNLSGVTFKLYGLTVGGTEAEVTSSNNSGNTVTVNPGTADTTSVSGVTRYSASITGTISWDSKATDPIAYYYLRVSAGADSAGNTISVDPPPAAQRGVPVSIRGVAASIADTTEFYIAIDFGAPASALDASKEGDIALRVKTRDTITNATIVSGSLQAGLPTDAVSNPDFSDLTAGQSIHFRVKPSGTLDGGESAAGAEVFEVILPASLVTVEGESNSSDPIDVQAIENGAPEVVSLELDNQAKTLDCGTSTAAAPNCTLGDIVYKMTLTEAVSNLASSSPTSGIMLYRSAADAMSLLAALNAGKSFSEADYISAGIPAASVAAVTGDAKSYQVTFSGVTHSNATSDTSSFVAVIAASLFGANSSVQDSGGAKLEDCQGMVWYGGSVRTAPRDTACVSQNAADAPIAGLPTASIIPDAAGDNIVGIGDDRTVFVARAGLAIESFAERLKFFGLQMQSGSSVKQAQVFKLSGNTRGDKLDFALQESNVDQAVEWEFADSRGFGAGTLSTLKDKLHVVRDVSFSRERGFIGADDTSFAATVVTDKSADAAATITLNAADGSGSGSASIAADATMGSASLTVDSAADTVTYRISTAGNVWQVGESLATLTVTGAVAVGRVPEIQISRADLTKRPITFGEISREALDNNTPRTSPLSIGFGGPTGGSYDVTASGSGGISSVTKGDLTSGAATATQALTVTWGATAATANSVLNVALTHTASDGSTQSAAIQIHFPPVGATELDGADSDGDGIPADANADPNDAVTALPLGHTAASLSFMHPAGSANIRASVASLNRVRNNLSSTNDLLREFRANQSGVYTYMLHNGLPDIAGGMFASGKLGTVISLSHADAWSVQGLNASVGGSYGIFDSNGMGCPVDANVSSSDGSSPYRDASGNLKQGARGDCMVVYIEDGSTSDGDGAVNGNVDGDILLVSGVSDAPFGRRGGGGGAVSGVELYGLLTLLALSLGYGLIRRRRVCKVSRSKMN